MKSIPLYLTGKKIQVGNRYVSASSKCRRNKYIFENVKVGREGFVPAAEKLHQTWQAHADRKAGILVGKHFRNLLMDEEDFESHG